MIKGFIMRLQKMLKLKSGFLLLCVLMCAVTTGIKAQAPSGGEGTTVAEPYSITATFHDSPGQYGINWHSKTAYLKPQIQYAKTVSSEKNTVDNVPHYARSGYYVYKGALAGLEPGQKYFYRVGDVDSGVWSEWGSFETETGGNNAWTFFHMTDTQNSHGVWNNVLKTAFKTYQDAKFILHTGDLVGNGQNLSEWQNAFQVTEETIRHTLITSIAGTTHENIGSELYDHFNIHVPNDQKPEYGFYYSYDYNDVHFTMLDVGTHHRLRGGKLGEDQIEWLKKDLADTDKQWKIVGIHWSLYGTGPWSPLGEVTVVKNQLIPIFEEYGVHLVVSGHDHVYTRSRQLQNGKVLAGNHRSEEVDGNQIDFAVNPKGTIYVSLNPSGAPGRVPNDYNKPLAGVYGQPRLPMFGAVTIDGNRLIYKTYTVDGEQAILYDSFGILLDETAEEEPIVESAPKKYDWQYNDSHWRPGKDDVLSNKGTERWLNAPISRIHAANPQVLEDVQFSLRLDSKMSEGDGNIGFVVNISERDQLFLRLNTKTEKMDLYRGNIGGGLTLLTQFRYSDFDGYYYPLEIGRWYDFTIRFTDNTVEFFIDGSCLLKQTGLDVEFSKTPLSFWIQTYNNLVSLNLPGISNEGAPGTFGMDKPWINVREYAICPWRPGFVRGQFYNPYANKDADIFSYTEEEIDLYVQMMGELGFTGVQILSTCYTWGSFGSIDDAQEKIKQIAKAAKKHGQTVTLWVWAAQFSAYGWVDPDFLKSRDAYFGSYPAGAYEDEETFQLFDRYYTKYAELAPYVDRLISHFFDPGALSDYNDVMKFNKLLEGKFLAANPKVKFGLDTWGRSGFNNALIERKDSLAGYLLLELTLPVSASARAEFRNKAKDNGFESGVWGWYTAEYETDQMAGMYVNAKVLKGVYRQMRRDADHAGVPVYWSEMSATHIYNIFTMYAAAQLLIDPDRDPDELLLEIAEMVFGAKYKDQMFEVLSLIQDARSGDSWDTYWWQRADYVIKSNNRLIVNWNDILARAEKAEQLLHNLKENADFTPSIPLPKSPETIIGMILPNVMQIKQYAQFRIDFDKLNTMRQEESSPEELAAFLNEIYHPIPDYDTWVGTFGQPEQRAQTAFVEEFCKAVGIDFPARESMIAENARRTLDRMQILQRLSKDRSSFNVPRMLSNYLDMSQLQTQFVIERLLQNGDIEQDGSNYMLVDWETHAYREESRE